jgi:hypothetical protein
MEAPPRELEPTLCPKAGGTARPGGGLAQLTQQVKVTVPSLAKDIEKT